MMNNFSLHNITTIKKDIYDEYSSMYFKISILPYLVIYIAMLLLFSLFLLYYKMYVWMAIVVVVAIIFPIFLYFEYQKKSQKEYQSYFMKENPIIFEYFFYENRMEVKIGVGVSSKSYEHLYINIKRVEETKENIFVFVDKKLIYLISKDGFTPNKFDKLAFQSLIKQYVKKYGENNE